MCYADYAQLLKTLCLVLKTGERVLADAFKLLPPFGEGHWKTRANRDGIGTHDAARRLPGHLTVSCLTHTTEVHWVKTQDLLASCRDSS